ncbi:class I adenylate-forming enzyme family protein [Allorhizocola rhizosphaerae]|uniref:class I adenylate-forming enzyme family protein n=1 Tax=Allorhizocola rhizosphaerae TaxID=1872709 RepID=UPI0013C36773|nr:fatty acid--CoA ligase family protein [Allorhizocola rhizosphaerae]
MLSALRSAPDTPAVESNGRVVTRGELLGMARRIAGGFAKMGLGRGVGVGLRLPLTPEAYAAHLAAHVLGATVAAFRPAWGPAQLESARAHVDVVVDDLTDLLAAEPLDVTPRAHPDDVARLLFTSGTTGRPKACAHKYRAIGLAYEKDRWPAPLARMMRDFSRYLVIAHISGPPMFTYLGRTLVAGGTAVLIGDGMGVPEAIARTGCTAVVMRPPLLAATLDSTVDLGGLRAVVLGGSPASPALLEAATARLGPIVWQVYGQSEAGAISMLTPDDIAAGHAASVGRPVSDVELDIREGEIWVRSPHMMSGYLDETEDVLRDGWLNTRDRGHVDADGRLHLTGRSRDVIMVNAEVCYAGAIERVLALHPDVAQAFAVGVPDRRTGEAIHAFVVPAGDRRPPPDELTALTRLHLSVNSVPSTFTVIHDIPLTATGKPDKPALFRAASPEEI